MNKTFELKEDTKAVSTINVSDPEATIFFSVEPSVDMQLVLILAHSSPPNSSYSSNTTILSREGDKLRLLHHFFSSQRCWPQLRGVSVFCPLGGYRWMITPDMLQKTTGLWYIEAKPFNSTQVPSLKLRISSFLTKCLYWDEKNQTWSTDGCQAGVPHDQLFSPATAASTCQRASSDHRWERRARRSVHSVCATTSRCSGAPSS